MTTFGLLRPHEIAAELGKRLQQHRLQQNKTQAQLAQHIGVSTPTISNLENGKNTSLEIFIHVIVALGLTKGLEKLFKPTNLTIAKLEQLNSQPGIVADALPDGWGRLLMDSLFRKRGLNPLQIGVLERLSDTAMGALTFHFIFTN